MLHKSKSSRQQNLSFFFLNNKFVFLFKLKEQNNNSFFLKQDHEKKWFKDYHHNDLRLYKNNETNPTRRFPGGIMMRVEVLY